MKVSYYDRKEEEVKKIKNVVSVAIHPDNDEIYIKYENRTNKLDYLTESKTLELSKISDFEVKS